VPIYYKAVAHVPAPEILAHRIAWSAVLLALLLLWLRRGRDVVAALGRRSTRRTLLLSAALVGVNWLTFIWGIAHDRVLECSLGYFINPLVIVLLGVIFLGERLRRWQLVAVLLAGSAVATLTIAAGKPPWIALLLAGTFGFYGLVRKKAPVEPLTGLAVEVVVLLPIALGFLAHRAFVGAGHFGGEWGTSVLLALAGAVTTVPLVWFLAAGKRLRYATIGFFQYLAPTGQFLLGVLAYGEEFTTLRALTFGGIWIALVIYSWDSWRALSRLRPPVPSPG
jgi:chloramphenicol-sensitive protein RarD